MEINADLAQFIKNDAQHETMANNDVTIVTSWDQDPLKDNVVGVHHQEKKELHQGIDNDNGADGTVNNDVQHENFIIKSEDQDPGSSNYVSLNKEQREMDNIDPALLEHNNDAQLQMANTGSVIGVSPNKVLKTDEHSAEVNMNNSEKCAEHWSC